MRSIVLSALLAAAAPVVVHAHEAPATAAQSTAVPREELLRPPADASHYVVVSEAGKHGDMWRWTLPDGRIAYRHSQSLRGWISETDALVRLGPDGFPTSIEIRGISPSGDAAETFAVASDGTATWKATSDSGSTRERGYYIPTGGPGLMQDTLTDLLVKAGDRGVDLLPSGTAVLTRAGEITATGPGGPRSIRLAFVRGIGASPFPVWINPDGSFFGSVGWSSILPAGYEDNAGAMRDAQDAATAEAIREVAAKFLAEPARAPVLFDNVRIFDSDSGRFLEDRAVLVGDGKISAIGAAGSIKAPAGARTVDGSGKTLIPGLWDSHLHIGDDWDVLANVATGITSFRSPGTMIERAHSVVKRRASGELLMGEPFISVLVDKKDPLAAQGALTVSSEAEAIEAVRTIKAAGLSGVKFYTSMNPAWIAPAAAEAHRLGLHVSGHIPAGMRPSEAVRAGYDEITHINFAVMEAMPQEVVDKANTAARIEGPARYAKDLNLSQPPMAGFIADLARRKTIVDPTLVVWEQALTSDGGVAAPAYAPYLGLISPVYDRYFKGGGHPLVEGTTRDDYRKSFAKLIELVGAMHSAGVPIIAGTDGSGIELVRELELYQQAGLTPAQALQSATIIPARNVGADNRTGSIVVGKEADLVLVDGDPSTDLGALRRVVTVVSDGYLMDGDELRSAAGWSGRPQ
jgi:imidazolonepropionase-like amidohydrolase